MTDETGSPAGSEAVSLPADAPETFDSPSAAAAYYKELREKPDKETAESAEEPATADPELSKDDSDPETAPAEQTEEAEPEEKLPPIDPPRSWTQAEKERFQSLPRETQEYLSHREQERETALRRSQNEIAEQRKAIEAKLSEADKVRQQYEAQLPALMQELQNAQQNAFSDIRTVDDVTKLAAEDPFRYLQWQAHQTKLQAVKAESDRANQAKEAAHHSEWTQHVQKENELAAEYIPDLADKVKGPALTHRVATELLPELGFKDSELADLANGKAKLSIYDHRIQRLLADSLKLRDIQAAPKAVVKPNLPPVQRPGTARPSGSANSERIQSLTRQLNETGDLRVAQELRALQASQRRTS